MKILLISGFLGAGKTTFIKAMAKATGREFVIVENEFAEDGIDGQLLSQDEATAKMEIREIAEGCICCSLNLDFSLSVLTIANTLHPDYLLVEPSGVAQPTAIIENLEKIQYERISLLAPITIIDAENYFQQRKQFRNYFEDQLIAAGTLVLSKSESLSPKEFAEIASFLDVPEDVDFPDRHYSRWSKEEWLSLLTKEFSGEDIKRVGDRFTSRGIKREADEELESLSLDELSFNNPDQLYAFLEEILQGKFGDILRAKGFVTFHNETLHVELVSNQFSLTGLGDICPKELSHELFRVKGAGDERITLNKLIIIGKYLKKEALQERARESL